MMDREQIIATWKKRFLAVTGGALIGTALWMPGMQALAYDGDYDSSFTFSEDGIEAEGEESGYKISGTELTIQAPGTYLVTGNCAEGSIRIKKETTGVVLILSDLNLKSSETSPLVVAKSAEATIVIDGNNTLTDAEDPANETSSDADVADAFEGAAIKIKSGATAIFLGTGTLTADGSECKNGIKGGAQAEIILGTSATDSFTLRAEAANNALAGDGTVTINGGTISLTADGDGLKASPDDDDTESKGEITIHGGTLEIKTGEDGIQAAGDILIDGGEITICSGDDGIHSEYNLTIGKENEESGPKIVIAESYEGLEAAVLRMYSGDVRVNSSDDGLNAANSDLSGYSFSLNIEGGSLYVSAEGDGLDSNGSLYLAGGTVEVYGSANGDNAALDYERPGTLSVDGSTVLAVGNSSMAENPSEGCYVTFGASGGMSGGPGGMGRPGDRGSMSGSSSISISQGTSIEIRDSSGNALYSGKGVRSANYVLFASPELTAGESYSLYLNGSCVATSAAVSGNSSGQNDPGNNGLSGSDVPSEPEKPGKDVQVSGNSFSREDAVKGITVIDADHTLRLQLDENGAFTSAVITGADGKTDIAVDSYIANIYTGKKNDDGTEQFFSLVFTDGRWDTSYDSSTMGAYAYQGESYMVAGGVVNQNANGLQYTGDIDGWKFLAAGKVVRNNAGLVMYQDKWFWIDDTGSCDQEYAAIVRWSGADFLVHGGRLRTDFTGFAYDPQNKSKWYHITNGQVWGDGEITDRSIEGGERTETVVNGVVQ